MVDTNAFRHGGVQFPLTDATTNALLQDADPALFHALAFFAEVLKIHVGDRLLAQAKLEGLNFPSAVVRTLHVEPSPFLLSHQFQFPLLALYRRSEDSDEGSVSYDRDVSEWELSYVLPSLNPRQVEQLQPILRAASRAIAKAARLGWDNGYLDGASVWDLAGIEKARVTRSSYGVYEPIDENPSSFRSVVCTLKVVEYDKHVDDLRPVFDGATMNVDVLAPDETVVPDVAAVSTFQAPTLSSIVPNLGTKAGGTTVTLTGTGFRPGTTPIVALGGARCTDVVVLSATQVRAVTPAHEAYPSFIADVELLADDGQSATLPYAFTFTTP